jgi:fructose-1,6-bisphosphatase/inositol monophosphatase family enzyme
MTTAAVVTAPGHNKAYWAEEGKGTYGLRVAAATDEAPHWVEEAIHVRRRAETGGRRGQLKTVLQERTVEILLVKESEFLELAVIAQIHEADRRAIKMIDSGALALAMMGTERDAVVTGGLTEYDKTGGLLIAKEAGSAMGEIQLTGHEGEPGGTVHVVASDVPMCRALERVVRNAIMHNTSDLTR